MNLSTRALVATTAIQVAAAAAALALPSIAPLVASDLGQASSTVGTYISLLYLGAAVAAVVGGGFLRRYGAVRVSQIGLVLCAIGLILGVMPAVAAVALGAVVLGLGYGPITPASSEVLARTTPPEKMGLVFSIKQTGVPAGTALAGIIVPPLAVWLGWHAAVMVMALICVVILLAAQRVRAPLDASRDPQAPVSLAAVATALRLVANIPALRRLALVSFVYNGMQMCVSTFIVVYLVESIGLSLVLAGLGLTAANAAGVFGRIFWGGVADRVGSPRLTLAALGAMTSVSAVLLAGFSAQWPVPLMLGVCAVLGCTAIGWNGVYLAQVARSAPAGQAGVATGGCLFFTFVGAVASPFLFGVLQRITGSYSASFCAAAALCAAIAVWLVFSPAAGRTRGRD
ncbi:MAG: MFS transporter [Burkholderiaceae bacterium]